LNALGFWATSLALLLPSAPASADLGTDLDRLHRALGAQAHVERLKPRLVERGDTLSLVLPAWALDPERGDCTTLALLAPVRSHFVLHVAAGAGLPHTALPSSGGAVMLTRCGPQRLGLLRLGLEVRSPRVVVHSLVAVGSEPPAPLINSLPDRDTGPSAAPGDAGPPPPRPPVAETLRSFERRAWSEGASAVRNLEVPQSTGIVVALEPGCHRLLVTSGEPRLPYFVELRQADSDTPERLAASELGDVNSELCTVRPRPILVSIQAPDVSVERRVAVASFPLPLGLPSRFGPEVAERIARALGGTSAPRQLGWLTYASVGAQGLTGLPRALLPQSCYVAAVAPLHGQARALSLGARAEGMPREAHAAADGAGARVGFCTGRVGQVELEVEARGLGVAWLLVLFRVGPATPEPS
jgi:hypothetical protein